MSEWEGSEQSAKDEVIALISIFSPCMQLLLRKLLVKQASLLQFRIQEPTHYISPEKVLSNFV